jgi:hypothetical protein
MHDKFIANNRKDNRRNGWLPVIFGIFNSSAPACFNLGIDKRSTF